MLQVLNDEIVRKHVDLCRKADPIVLPLKVLLLSESAYSGLVQFTKLKETHRRIKWRTYAPIQIKHNPVEQLWLCLENDLSCKSFLLSERPYN